MIVTVIPFVLLANLPNDAVWNNGPEFKFDSSVLAYARGFENNTIANVLEVKNDLTCRPKGFDVLSCKFKHTNFTTFKYNETSESVLEKHDAGESMRYIFEKIPFEIKFDKRGVQGLIISKSATKDFRIDLLKMIANMFNVGVNLREVKFEPMGEALKFKQNLNFLLGECQVEIKVVLTEKRYSQNEFNLNLDPSIEQLSDRELFIVKRRNNTKCISSLKSLWSGFHLDDIQFDENLNVKVAFDHMRFSFNEFNTGTTTEMETVRDGERINIREGILSSLSDIYAAEGEIQKIEDPVTITFDQETEDENKINTK